MTPPPEREGDPISTPEREYVLGTDEAELARLGLQHRLWAEYAYALWERAGFRPGQTLLDLGCGPGYAALDLAALVGERGRVVAVDKSARFIAHLERTCRALGISHVEPRRMDLHEMELPEASLDGAYARWVFCFVPDPEPIVATVARALRPGGVLAVQDYFNYRAICLAPNRAVMDRVAAAVDASWRRAGGDGDVAGRLPGMMRRAGLEVREIRPILRVARPGGTLWSWPDTFFRNYLPFLVEQGLLSEADKRAFEEEWDRASRDDTAFFVTPPVFDILAVKPSRD